jgi:hypothetical protein
LDCHARVMTEADGRRSDCDLGRSGVPFSSRGHSEFTDAVERSGHPVTVEVVASEAVEMPSQVWAGASDQVRANDSAKIECSNLIISSVILNFVQSVLIHEFALLFSVLESSTMVA